MSDPRDDFLLDLFLEEALSGIQPPDVSQRVLSALAARAGASPAAGASAPPSLRPIPLTVVAGNSVDAAQPVPVAPALVAGNDPVAIKHRPALVSLVLAASLLLSVAVVWRVAGRNVPRIAQKEPSADLSSLNARETPRKVANNQSVAGSASVPASDASSIDHRPANPPPSDLPADGAPLAAVESDSANRRPADEPHSPPSDLPDSNDFDRSDFDRNDREVVAASLGAGLSSSAVSDADVVAYINGAIRARAQEAGMRLSPPATDAEWCRRVHLDLIGRIPTLDELESFLVDNGPNKSGPNKSGPNQNARNKRARLVDRLLGY
ncbi:MAG TPA: DUF1549 domain-containing protein, partial [Pirellulales bacterium]|nr:DUF1549 domain-containing protein [Pirellulales bacterium]